jgi:aminoglycoside phosphotransferase (APT) family kinase protein
VVTSRAGPVVSTPHGSTPAAAPHRPPPGTPHGYRLQPGLHRLLRDRPPTPALDWVAGQVAPAARVVRVRALAGGTSAAMHLIWVRAGDTTVRLVLRRFVRPDWLAEEPDAASREASTLELLRDCPVPVPRLVAVDPTGQHIDAPAVLMTALPGRVDWAPRNPAGWLDRLAAMLPRIHELPTAAGIRPYRPYDLGMPMRVPRWVRHRATWQRAIDIYHGPVPSVETRFIHRDFHPGNVLWRRGVISGVVDWAAASLGCPEADVGHCRANLVLQCGAAVAEDFLDRYQRISGRTGYHPYWDLQVIDMFGADGGEPAPAVDEFVAAAVARL